MQRTFGLFLCAICLILSAGCTNNRQGTDLPESETSRLAESVPPTDNKPQKADTKATDVFNVRLKTSKGDIVVEVHPEWAPKGAERFRKLVESNFYDGCRFFRVLPNFMAQFGINGNPDVQKLWRNKNIPDDPRKKSNTRGMVTFAKTDLPNSRSTQVFISYGDNSRLDGQGFSPFGKVIEGMDVADAINAEYREKPDQSRVQSQGNAYLNRDFPNLDYIETATIVE